MRFRLPTIILLLLPFFSISLLAIPRETPWGKDAELVYQSKQKKNLEKDNIFTQLAKPNDCISHKQKKTHQSPLAKIAESLIWFHQNVISPADGPRSHFVPSSSQYTLDAIRKYGFIKGYFLGCDRLMRENREEWVYSKAIGKYGILKYDPVQ